MNDACISPNGQWMCVVDSNQQLIRYDLNTEEVLDTYDHDANIRSVACSNNYIVVGTGDRHHNLNKVVLHDVFSELKIVQEFVHESRVIAVDIYDSQPWNTELGTIYVAAADRSCKCLVYELNPITKEPLVSMVSQLLPISSISTTTETLQKLFETKIKYTFTAEESMNAISFSPWRSDGVEYIATADNENKVIVRNMSNGKIHRQWMHEAWVNCVCFSPGKGTYVAAGDDANKVVLYDVATGKHVVILLFKILFFILLIMY